MPLIEAGRGPDRPRAESRMRLDGMPRVMWRKSSYSGSTGGDCAEVARLGGLRAVRDSKNPHGEVLGFTTSEWRALLTDIRRGAYDR